MGKANSASQKTIIANNGSAVNGKTEIAELANFLDNSIDEISAPIVESKIDEAPIVDTTIDIVKKVVDLSIDEDDDAAELAVQQFLMGIAATKPTIAKTTSVKKTDYTALTIEQLQDKLDKFTIDLSKEPLYHATKMAGIKADTPEPLEPQIVKSIKKRLFTLVNMSDREDPINGAVMLMIRDLENRPAVLAAKLGAEEKSHNAEMNRCNNGIASISAEIVRRGLDLTKMIQKADLAAASAK